MLKNYRGKILLVWILVISGVLIGCTEDISNAERKLKAQQMSSKHEYRSAIIELKNVLQNDSSDSEARLALAEIYNITGQGASAEKEISKVKGALKESEHAVVLLAEALVMQRKNQDFVENIKIVDSFSNEAKEKLHLQRAKVNLSLGKIDLAESEYKAILSESPKVAAAFTGLAMIDLSRDQYPKGLKNLKLAIEADPSFADAWRLKGLANNKLGKYEESEQAFREAIALYKEKLQTQGEFISRVGLIQSLLVLKKSEQFVEETKELKRLSAEHPLTLYFSALNDFLKKSYQAAERDLSLLISRVPDHLPSLLLLGSVHYALGNYEQANTHLTQFINSVPTHLQARKILGATRMKLKRPEDALEVLTPIAGSGVDDAQILAMVGMAASQSDQRALASSYFERASKASPGNYLLREELAKSYLQGGDYDSAIATLQIESGDDEVRAKLLLTYAYLQKKEIKKAKQVISALIAKYPDAERVRLVEATIDLIEGKRAEARVKLEKLERENSKSIPVLFALAKIYLEDGDLKKSRERFERVLALDENNVQIMTSLAMLEEQAGSTEKSLMWLEQARKVDSAAQLPRLILSRYFLKLGKLDKALESAKELAAIDEKNAVSLVQYASVLLAMNNPEKAAQTYENLIEYHPNDLRGYIALSRIYGRLGKRDKAVIVLSKMESITNGKRAADIARIELELRSKNPDAAMKLAVAVLSKNPKDFAANMLLASAKIAKEDIDGAIATLRNVIKFSDRKEPILQLTQLQLKMKNKKDAISELEKWLKKNKNPDVRFFLASLYQSYNDLTSAESHYKELLKQDDSNPLILNNLTLVYLESNIKAALETAELAMKRGRDKPEIIDTYGWVLVNAGETDKGIEQLRKANSLVNNPEIKYHLAFALEKTGKTEESLKLLNELEKGSSLSDELRTLVQQLQQQLSSN